jgi:hypothetical protein
MIYKINFDTRRNWVNIYQDIYIEARTTGVQIFIVMKNKGKAQT